MSKIRCISAEIYKYKSQDCSNGGISSHYDTVYIPCKDGCDMIDEDNPQLCKVVKRDLGRITYHIEPYKPAKHIGWMAGGCFVDCCDSRFSEMFNFYGAVALHDRQETQAEYDALSR